MVRRCLSMRARTQPSGQLHEACPFHAVLFETDVLHGNFSAVLVRRRLFIWYTSLTTGLSRAHADLDMLPLAAHAGPRFRSVGVGHPVDRHGSAARPQQGAA
eukprot:7388765-Prymnesium_polylepis.1